MDMLAKTMDAMLQASDPFQVLQVSYEIIASLWRSLRLTVRAINMPEIAECCDSRDSPVLGHALLGVWADGQVNELTLQISWMTAPVY